MTEGAGSPAETNLRAGDIANMGFARAADVPVVLVGDLDRGHVIASLVGGMDEAHGSWGQMGTEIACKSWLSGGRLVVNKATWFAHMFRTRADFSFPYAMSGNQVDQARKYSMELWLNDGWEGQVYSLAWLINKFKPLPGWHEPVGRDRLAHIRNSERAFYATHPRRDKVLPI
jgi:hypothetical protein